MSSILITHPFSPIAIKASDTNHGSATHFSFLVLPPPSFTLQTYDELHHFFNPPILNEITLKRVTMTITADIAKPRSTCHSILASKLGVVHRKTEKPSRAKANNDLKKSLKTIFISIVP